MPKQRNQVLFSILLSLTFLSCGTVQETLEDVESDTRDIVNYESNNTTDTGAETPQDTEEDDTGSLPNSDCSSFIENRTRVGLACLHCAAPTARTQVLEIARIMRDACVQNVATTILLDGTFNDNLPQVLELIDTITEHGATLHFYVYLSNGPWQRRNNTPPFGVGTNLSGSQWSDAIQFDSNLRQLYVNNILRITPIFERVLEKGGILYLIPGLEDNLSYNGARAVEALTVQSVPLGIPYTMGRGPCCGADTSIAPGHFRDVHNFDAFAPNSGLFTNDGDDRRLEEYPFFLPKAREAGASFVMWTRDYQGIAPGNVFPHPDDRIYRMPTDEERSLFISVMRSS